MQYSFAQYSFDVFVEAVVVGFVTLTVGSLIGKAFQTQIQTPIECKNWNKNYAMEIGLFLTGFLIHVTFELAGLNLWYSQKGAAVLKNSKKISNMS